LSGNLSDSYHASGLEPCIFLPSQVVRDLVEDSDLSALIMSDDLKDTNKNTTTAVFNKHIVKFACKIVRTAKSKLLSKEGVGSSNPVLKHFLMVWDIFI
jgi:hypothetical protein